MKRAAVWILRRLDDVLLPVQRLPDEVAPWRVRWADRCFEAARKLEGR